MSIVVIFCELHCVKPTPGTAICTASTQPSSLSVWLCGTSASYTGYTGLGKIQQTNSIMAPSEFIHHKLRAVLSNVTLDIHWLFYCFKNNTSMTPHLQHTHRHTHRCHQRCWQGYKVSGFPSIYDQHTALLAKSKVLTDNLGVTSLIQPQSQRKAAEHVGHSLWL